jgi:hypothetical protein
VRFFRSTVLLCCLVGLLATFGSAQTTNATVNGLVIDASNAVVPGVQVQAIDEDTNIIYSTMTNNSGVYVLPPLPPGRYRLQVSKSGFATLIKPDITLNVQDAKAINFTLKVGAASETVTVAGGAPLVNTQDAAVSTVVDRKLLENIPLNGRSLQPLIELTPGVLVTPVTSTEQGQFSVNGQRANANYFMVDGVSATFGVSSSGAIGQAAAGTLPALTASGGTNSLVSIDAVEEFRIQTSSYAPEFGRTPGGQISIVTRSGTNQFHGNLFDYFRNDALDASNWFNGAVSPTLRKAPEHQNDFGGTLGGPLRKDRTFFFFSYEGLRLRQPSTGTATYPTIAFRQSAQAAWIKPILDAFPIPNGAFNSDGCTVTTSTGSVPCDAQFSASYSNPTSLNATSVRIDHRLNGHIGIFGRYNYASSTTSQRGVASPDVLHSRFPLQTMTIGSTQTIGSAISNEFRANYSTTAKRSQYVLDNLGGATPPPLSAMFPSRFSSTNSRFELMIGGISASLLQGAFASSKQHQFNVVDGLTVAHGSHQIKVGVDYRRMSTHTGAEPFVQTVQFLDLGGPPFGVRAGAINFYTAVAHGNSILTFDNVSLYGQDTWRIGTRATVTYGLRWDVNPPFQFSGSPGILTVQNLNKPASLALAPAGTPFYNTTWGNLAPRAGIAIKLLDKHSFETVLRGGVGVFYDLGGGSLAQAFAGFPNRQEADSIFKNLPFPLPASVAAPPQFATTIPPGGVPQVYAAEPDLQLPRTYEWNVAIEQSIGGKQSVTLTYDGAVGRQLLRFYDLFKPNITFQNVNVLQNSATSDYHAIQVQYRRELSHNLQALGFYSWSHSIDDASNDSSFFGSDARLDRGSSDFDIRHAFHGVITYAIPTPGGPRLAKSVFGGWSLDATGAIQSAPPIDLQSGKVILTGNQFVGSRPDVVAGQPLYLFGAQCLQVLGPPCAGGKGINPKAFTAPPANQQGTLGRNTLRGFGLGQLDTSVRRNFRLSEFLKLQFSAEFFNVLNRPNFGSSSIGKNLAQFPGLFGQAHQILAESLSPGQGQGGFSPLYQVGGPRSIQLELKLAF